MKVLYTNQLKPLQVCSRISSRVGEGGVISEEDLGATCTTAQGVLYKILYREAVQPLTLLFTILTEKVPFWYTFK